jgi:hypothetical protein
MVMPDFAHLVAGLKQLVGRARREGVSLQPSRARLGDFHSQQEEGLRASIRACILSIVSSAPVGLQTVVAGLQKVQGLPELERIADRLLDLVACDDAGRQFSVQKPRVPFEIRDDILSDFDEAQRCMAAGCFRSVVVLCARMLETALHRKYYDVARNDLLEKSPGIGLGNLVARLSEHNVRLDPGLGNQIHLINQVRVHSVHQKNDAFCPSQAQAQAVLLYTLDVIGKLFV